MRRRGFNLTDVIVACAILCVTSVLVLNLLPTAVLFLRGSQHRLEAARLCEEALEHATVQSEPQSAFDRDGYHVERSLRVVQPGRLAEVRARVTWSEKGRPKTLEMMTYVSSIGN